MVCIILGAVFELLGLGLYFYGEYASHDVALLAKALFGHGMINPGGMLKKVGIVLIVVGTVLLVAVIRSNRKGSVHRHADEDDFDDLDDLNDDLD